MNSPKKPSQRLRPIGIISVLAALTLINMSGEHLFNKEEIAADLKRFSEHAPLYAQRFGRQAAFSHGNIAITGWFFNRHAEVESMTLSVSRPSLISPESLEFTTGLVTIMPDPLHVRRHYYVFEGPVEMKSGGKPAATISFSEPFKYGHHETGRRMGSRMQQTFLFPAGITITPAGGKPEEATTITYDEGATLEIDAALDGTDRNSHYEFQSISIKQPGTGELTLADLSSQMNESKTEEKITGHYVLSAHELRIEGVKSACDGSISLDYSGDQPLFRLMGFAPSQPEGAVDIQELALNCEGFSIRAEGTLARDGQDPLPSGNIKLTISDVKAFMESGLLEDPVKTIFGQVVQQITGKPLADATSLEVPLRREKGGTLFIGDVAFEYMAANVLGEMLGLAKPMKPGKATPMPPAEEKPVEPALPDPEATLLEDAPATPTPALQD